MTQEKLPHRKELCLQSEPLKNQGFLKRVMGIEPTYPAWKAGVLPLNYTRMFIYEAGRPF